MSFRREHAAALCTPPHEASASEYCGGELETMTLAQNYYTWLSELFRPFLRGVVLDLGAGIGTFSKRLLTPEVTRLICVEPAQTLVPALRQELSMYGDRIVLLPIPAEELAIHVKEASLDAVVSVNVMEHIPEDAAVLRAVRDLVKPGGHVCLFVPAMPALMGSMDRVLGHVRRCPKRGVCGKLAAAGFRIVGARDWNVLGAAGCFWAGRVLKETAVSPTMVKILDRVGVPFLRVVERRLRLPFGQNVLVVAVRP